MRYSGSPINNQNKFDAATAFVGEPAPQVAGTAENITVTGLNSDTLHYFAIKVLDEVANL